MKESKRQHLEFIQNVITRMNTNSFQVKGVAITIVSALISIYASTNNTAFLFSGIAPTVLFWFLDSYYLQQERKFRGIYNNVAGLKNDIEIKPYEMPIHKFQDGQHCFYKAFFSKTIAWMYGTVILLLLFGGLILKYKECITINCK